MMTTEDKVQEAMKTLINCTNVMGSDRVVVEGMYQALIHSHPTLVQSFFRGLRDTCTKVNEEIPYYLDDGRLQGTKELVKMIASYEKPLPFI